MGLLKQLTKLKTNPEPEEKKDTKSFEDQRITYHQDGKNSSQICQGLAQNLKANLDAIYHRFENKCKEEEEQQSQLKQPYVTELKGKKTQLLNKNDELEESEGRVGEIETKIQKLEQDKIEVRRNPQDYGIPTNSKSSAKFWIGLMVLLPISVYIFIFYISTSYSGFFRNFDPSVDVFGGIFYPQALQKAWEDGLLEFGFIVFIPFVFFGLGYLIHMFQQEKSTMNTIKIAALFIVTFMFDAILAYLIDEKIYNLNKTFEDPEFSVGYALQDPAFWVIIFAGFVSYIIWGLVFDFVMKEHADRDKIKKYIDGLNIEISNKLEILNDLANKVDLLKDEIGKLKVRITELENIIDGFILPIRNYKAFSSEYLQGWQEHISGGLALSLDETQSRLRECQEVYDEHIKKLDLDSDTYQNKVYTKTL